jgi:hypothetical protein
VALPTAPAPLAKPTLRVTSDVGGAYVFVDRKFVGKTPLRPTEVVSGHHQVSVSAEGFASVSQDVDIGATGATDLNVSLKTVRLDASVAVVHKHTIGSCEGMLRADPEGLRYESSNRDDAFVLPFGELEIFTMDYMKKVLRVKKRGGRTWNFTTRAANANSLVTFQRDVDAARVRLSQGR